MADEWDAAVKAAQKILGDNGKIPKISPAIAKAAAADHKSYAEFKKVREELKVKLLATQDTSAIWKDALEQFQDEIDEDNLGLDPKKNKDDAQKIVAARKVLSAPIQGGIDTIDKDIKNLRELDRHLMNLMNYKQGS